MILCYCCSGDAFAHCCQPFLENVIAPETAEELMRSRYSAYALAKVEYLLSTTHSSTRKSYSTSSIKKWATSNKWLKLEIVSTEKGTISDSTGIVEFKAYYLNANKFPHIHQERSTFLKENGRWYYLEGKVSE
jgi:SEC-C motif-containing protein